MSSVVETPQKDLRIVFDTNILVRLVLGRSRTAEFLRKAWRNGQFTLILSPAIITELERVSQYPQVVKAFGVARDKLRAFLVIANQSAVFTLDLYEVDFLQTDVTDNIILACALEAHADYIVSEDAHLRNLKYYQGVQIIGLDRFVQLLQ